jgi:hypothetical protein
MDCEFNRLIMIDSIFFVIFLIEYFLTKLYKFSFDLLLCGYSHIMTQITSLAG